MSSTATWSATATRRSSVPEYVVRVLGAKKDSNGMMSAKNSSAPFFERIDWDAHDGKGAVYTTDNVKKAMRWPSGSQAFFYFREKSPHVPKDWPEKTYHPLMAYAISIEEVPSD